MAPPPPYPYTRPRGPVASMFASPGPKYMLPRTIGYQEVDPTHHTYPAYGFGRKTGHSQLDTGPGPAKYLPGAKMHRNGPEQQIQYSIRRRLQDKTGYNFPGPGTYSPENSGQSALPMTPHYSFGRRTAVRGKTQNPAPNQYSLPSMLGQNPQYSMAMRRDHGSIFHRGSTNPSPAQYNVKSASNGPSYSMAEKLDPVFNKNNSPGPATYSVDHVKVDKASAPEFSFGIKHSDFTAPLVSANDF